MSTIIKAFLVSAFVGYALSAYAVDDGTNFSQEPLKIVVDAAEQGDFIAQYDLATRYATGQGAPQNYDLATKWYRKAAEQGYAPAQYELGSCYAVGLGVPQNYDETFKWYTEAAEQGYANALYGLGHCYENGNGIQRDNTEAIKCYRKAAEQGHELAKQALQRLGADK